MKKIIFALIAILVLIAVVDGVIHSRIVQTKALSLFKESLQKSGWDVEIESIENAFPRLELKGATITAPDFELRFGTLKANFSFLRLLKGEIVFKNLEGDQVGWSLKESISGQKVATSSKRFILIIEKFHLTNANLFDDFLSTTNGSFSIIENRAGVMNFRADGIIVPQSAHPFLARNWNLSGRFHRNPNATWEFPRVRIESDIAALRAVGNLNSSGKITNSSIQIQSNYLARLFANVDAKQGPNGIEFQGQWRVPYFEFHDEEITNSSGEIAAIYANRNLEGTTSSTADYRHLLWKVSSPFVWNKDGIIFPNAELITSALEAKGELKIGKQSSLRAKFQSNQIHDIFPDYYGRATGEVDWNPTFIHLDAILTDVHYENLTAKEIKIYSDLHNGFHGNLVGDIKQGKWRNLNVEEASFETVTEGENWPFSLTLNGEWQHPLQLDLNGFWNYAKKNLVITLQNANGSFFNHPVALTTPTQFAMSKDTMLLKDFSLEIADASIRADLEQNKNLGSATLKIRRLPIDFLSLNPLDVAVVGLFNLDLSITEKEKDLRGDLFASFEDLEMSMLGTLDPLNATGNIESHFSHDRLDVKGKLMVRDAQLSTIDLSLPIHLEMQPFTVVPLYDKTVKGRIYLNGPIEEFLDFFNLGTHRFEGNCLVDFKISNTLEHPHLVGKCDFTNGFYQNYFTGTELQNINAHFLSDGGILTLKKFTAADAQSKGNFNATGQIQLLPLDHFPFNFDVNFSHFTIATLDLITTEGDGHLKIHGDLRNAIATGHLDIVESDVTVPTRLPKALPDLQVVYKNAIAPPYSFELPNQHPYPLFLDLSVDAPDGIFISGRGLDSEWKGQFQVGGKQTDVVAKGKIELIKGTFNFSNRSFKLSEGSLTFSGIPDVQPQLNLAAEIQIKDILVIANLKGPLNNPQISLQSNPPLPLGTIMAYVLFGRDLTEISSVQALQLAGSVASLVGEGPGIIEETKKSLGVDRIQVITVPSAKSESGETIAVQVGKYISEGVLVSYSQAAENTAGNISVEVEVKGNLSFILESDQADEQKQGKFTFRWAKTY